VLKRLTFITQLMAGNTKAGRRLEPSNKRAGDVDFFAAYGLLSRDFERWRLAFRYDYFETRNKDPIWWRYNNDEDGFAVTTAVQYKLYERIRLALELQYIDHERPVRSYGDLPEHLQEFALRGNVRWFF
jgi:hypothetical protein